MSIRSPRGRVAACLFMGSTSLLAGQVTKLENSDNFSGQAVGLNYKQQTRGAPAGDVFRRWGLHFFGSGGTVPQIVNFIPAVIVAPTVTPVLRNGSDGVGNAGEPLILELESPVARIGFSLGNGDEATTVTLTAFDRLGNQLGSIQQAGLPDSNRTPVFVGIETTDPQGISKILIGYGNDPEAEQVHSLFIDFLARPEFMTFLAQLGNGAFSLPGEGNLNLETTVVVSNLSNTTAEGEIRLTASDGTPLELTLSGQTGDSFPFTLKPFAATVLESDGLGGVKAGYAKINSSVPVEGTAVFRIRRADGSILREAGVGSTLGNTFAVAAVQRRPGAGLDSGLAVANASATDPLTGTISLIGSNGAVLAVNSDALNLGPGEHLAKFLSDPELFDLEALGLEGEDLDATLLISADGAFAVVALRTVDGLVLASLPVGSTQN